MKPLIGRPSYLGACKRRVVYYYQEVPKEGETEAQLRALKGSAYHLMAPQFWEYVTKTQPHFKELVKWEIVGHEKKVDCQWGSVTGQGTLDLLINLEWDNGLSESVVVDFKFYANIPFKPYPDNIWQVAAYCEAVGADSFYLIYIDDIQRIKIFRFAYMEVASTCEEYYLDVFKHLKDGASLPERLPFGDKQCKMCSYANHCWSDLIEFMDSESENTVLQPDDLPTAMQQRIVTFVQLREAAASSEKEIAQLRGEIINALLEKKAKEVDWSSNRDFRLRLLKSGKGYQLRVIKLQGDEEQEDA